VIPVQSVCSCSLDWWLSCNQGHSLTSYAGLIYLKRTRKLHLCPAYSRDSQRCLFLPHTLCFCKHREKCDLLTLCNLFKGVLILPTIGANFPNLFGAKGLVIGGVCDLVLVHSGSCQLIIIVCSIGGNDGDVVPECIYRHLVDIQRIRPMVHFPGTL
jgi:hypothetical protein